MGIISTHSWHRVRQTILLGKSLIYFKTVNSLGNTTLEGATFCEETFDNAFLSTII